MSVIIGFSIYFVLWWLTLFMVLPWGALHTGIHELKPIDEHDAPSKPKLLIKVRFNNHIVSPNVHPTGL